MKKILPLILAGLLTSVAAVSASAAMFTDFEGYESFEKGENPVYNFEDPADYWDGAWSDGGDNGDELICEIRDGVGFGGSKGLAVGSMGNSNVGTYLFATANNKIPTDYTGSKYLRVWCDFTEVEFRKANFGIVDNMNCLFTTDEVDGAWDCEFYYSADGVNWEEYFHGGDGCFGDAQGSYVQETKGWYAFPIEDFAIRGNANWEAYDELTVANPSAITGVYLFWDYSDAGDYAGKTFILDNIEFVADYTADLPTGDAAGASAVISAEYMDYQATDPIASNGACDDAEAAAASFGKTLIDATYTFIDGTNGFGNEGPENLWDDDVTTKFCTNEYPTLSLAELSVPCTIDGLVMATANDNASYNGRSPFEWAVFVSADGAAWTQLAYGDDTFFEETDFTYYGAAAPKAVDNVKYVLFQSEGGLSGVFQVSELALTGKAGAAAAAEAPAPVVEEAPAPVEEAPAPVEEAPAEPETVEAPAEAAPVAAPAPAAAPETFDAGIIAAVAAVVSLAGYAASKKH